MTAQEPQIQVATTGIFGLGLQAAKGVPRTQNTLFNYFPMTGIGYGLNQGLANLPPESGKSTTLRGAYKTGVSGDGQITMIPRLIDKFSTFLLMLMGKDTVTTGQNLAGSAVTGSNVHLFAFDTNEVFVPYASTRKIIPGPRKLAELSQDARVGRGEISIPAVGPMTVSLGMSGRNPNGAALFVNDPDTPMALSSIVYENDDSFANTVDPLSVVSIMGVNQYCSGISLSVINELTPGDQTRIVGSQTPFDYVVLSRAVSIRATVMFTDKTLYQAMLAGSAADATTWSSAPLTGDVNFTLYSPDTISGSSPVTQRAIQFRTTNGNIVWSLDGPLSMQPRQMMALNLIGSVKRPTAGNYFEVRLQNGIATAYTQYKVAPITTVTSFVAASHKIVGTGFTSFGTGDLVVVTGAANAANNGIFSVATGSDATNLILLASDNVSASGVVDETVSPAGSVSICA